VTSVVIADDHELVRSGLRLLLETRGIEVLGEAGDGRQAIAEVARTGPDVALLDIRMPRLDGIAATREIMRATPATRVLILTTYDLDEYVYHALRAGACGFLLKATPPDMLAAGVRTVAAGEAMLAPALTRRLIEEHISRPPPAARPPAVAGLTARELDVLCQIARGLSNDGIAKTLHLSPATVKTHVNRLLTKLSLSSRVQAVVLAYESGLIRPGLGPVDPERPRS
jgi:DNA-binding NarL/FixJ family response regulator